MSSHEARAKKASMVYAHAPDIQRVFVEAYIQGAKRATSLTNTRVKQRIGRHFIELPWETRKKLIRLLQD